MIATPDLDRPDVRYGEVEMARVGQKAQPLPARRLPPDIAIPAKGRLPRWFFEMPSARPEEPVTAGSELGPGPGPEALMIPPEEQLDLREAVLGAMWQYFGNPDALRLLNEIRAQKSAAVMPAPPAAPAAEEGTIEPPFEEEPVPGQRLAVFPQAAEGFEEEEVESAATEDGGALPEPVEGSAEAEVTAEPEEGSTAR